MAAADTLTGMIRRTGRAGLTEIDRGLAAARGHARLALGRVVRIAIVLARCPDREPPVALLAPCETGAALAEAQHEAEQWRQRVQAAEGRAADLERRLAAAEMDVLELRSRNVCLHGKLAAAHATARYQVLAQELDTAPATPSLVASSRRS